MFNGHLHGRLQRSEQLSTTAHESEGPSDKEIANKTQNEIQSQTQTRNRMKYNVKYSKYNQDAQ